MNQQPDTMSVEEFLDALDNVRADVLASHLIQMEELRAIRGEVFDREQEVRQFFDCRKTAVRALLSDHDKQREIVRSVLERARPDTPR